MPFFKTTHNILVDNREYFDPNWMDSDKLVLPPKKEWDYQREMQIEDVDIWELIAENGSVGVYAAWSPYAEFYLVKPPWWVMEKGWGLETYYGKGALKQVKKRMQELGLYIPDIKHWVEPEDMWLYED
jgi:hypothetical protein